MGWQTGQFVLRRNIPPPTVSIETDWNSLLLEGLRLLDENEEESLAIEDDITEDKDMALKTRSELLNETLQAILEDSFDIQGALIVSRDGLVMASRLPAGLEDNRVGAISAGVLSLGVRSITQLGRGDFNQILAQGTKGNVVVTGAGAKAAFVALTAANINLGMVFLEAREAAERIAQILD